MFSEAKSAADVQFSSCTQDFQIIQEEVFFLPIATNHLFLQLMANSVDLKWTSNI